MFDHENGQVCCVLPEIIGSALLKNHHTVFIIIKNILNLKTLGHKKFPTKFGLKIKMSTENLKFPKVLKFGTF